MLKHIQNSAEFIKNKINSSATAIDSVAQIGVILGTGLGGLIKDLTVLCEIPYSEIPGFPVSTVESHQGKLLFAEYHGKKIIVMQGRFHYYEGYSMQQIAFPVRVMKQLGVQRLFVSNASGGVNPGFAIGDLMIIRDHINFFHSNPLIGKNDPELGPRFPDMSEPYDKQLISQALQIAAANKIKVQTGVYLGLSGPAFETPAEYKMVRILGADAVGMSTVPEIIAARHLGLSCFAISIITDLGIENKIVKITLEDVIKEAAIAEPKLSLIIKELIRCSD